MKPALFKNELLATTDPLHTWIFEGLWCMADREGRLEDRPRRIHLEINPGRAYEGTEAALAWLAEQGFILRYQHSGGEYIQIINFRKHQNPHMREPASTIPEPGVSTEQASDIGAHVEHSESDASTVQAPDKHGTGPALSPSPFPDSPSLKDMSSQNGSRVSAKAIDRVFHHWQQELKHPRAKCDEKRRRVIANALKAYSFEDVTESISGYAKSPFHCGQNDRGVAFDSIELILKDAKHIEQGLEFSRNPPSGTRGTPPDDGAYI